MALLHIVFVAHREWPDLLERWRKRGCRIEFIPVDRLIEHLKGPEACSWLVDAIVCSTSDLVSVGTIAFGSVTTEAIAKLSSDFRQLPDSCAMSDGRKWKSIPLVALLSNPLTGGPFAPPVLEGVRIVEYQDEHDDDAIESIRQAVEEYRKRLLDELDNMGFLVSYDHGRFRVGPALKPKRDLEGYYYYGPADTREQAKCRFFTVHRDTYGVQYEVEKFEALINNPQISEPELQKFFEDHPHFLLIQDMAQALPHPRFVDQDGALLIPDFMLKPVVAEQRDSKWEVLDLKLPTSNLLSGPARHRGFSQAVIKAITQLRNYGDYFQNPANASVIKSVLGRPLRYPRLAVLIGRLPSSENEIEAFERAQSREPYVRVVTYDEILETQSTYLK